MITCEQICEHCLATLPIVEEYLRSTGSPVEIVENDIRNGFAGAVGLRMSDGRVFLLLKQKVGWKGNFEGVLCFDGHLNDSELFSGDDGRSYISLCDNQPFQELYIRSVNSEYCIAVYFDLY